MIFSGGRINLRGMKITKLPAIERFEGDEDRDLDPLDQFYAYVNELYFVHGGLVYINPKAIHICPQDSEKLFRQLRDYFYALAGSQGANHAAHLWMHRAPREMREVPPGYAFIEPGSIFIQGDGDVSPRVEH